MELPACPGCRERDARIALLERRVAELEAQVRDLLARLGNNSSNSSVPPSANPLHAPKPVVKKRTGRKPGGQPGHPPHLKQLLPPERVKDIIHFVPSHCGQCQAPLSAQASADDPPPTRHQVAELPPLVAEITEYQGHARTCPCCGEVTRATIPADIRAHCCGPRLTATLAYLTGGHQLSKRAVEEISEDVFAAPVALGTVSALEQEVAAALEPAHAEALQAVKEAPVKNVDETSWKQGGRKRWLWVAATAHVAIFVICVRRNLPALARLLGNTIYGFLCSDRWSVYDHWPTAQRQVCWSHLKPRLPEMRRSGRARGPTSVEAVCGSSSGSSRPGTCIAVAGCRTRPCVSDSTRWRATCGSCSTQGVTAPIARPRHFAPTW